MNEVKALNTFAAKAALQNASETERACLLAYFHYKVHGVQEFTANNVSEWFGALHLAKPNLSRLKSNLKGCRDTVKGTAEGSFRLHHKFVVTQAAKFPELEEPSQDVVDEGTILPPSLYKGTRGYLERIAAQINVTYEANAFDGCAVLMRRLTEILLILAYEELSIAGSIKDSAGNYFMLEGICSDAKSNATLNLSRNSKTSIEVFRQLGNFSAHKITYTCRREYIQQEILGFRALVDELLHKAAILK